MQVVVFFFFLLQCIHAHNDRDGYRIVFWVYDIHILEAYVLLSFCTCRHICFRYFVALPIVIHIGSFIEI